MQDQIRYFDIEGVPGHYFECLSYGSMSTASCARNFADAPEQIKRGRLDKCIGCSAGRAHSGLPAEAAAAAPVASSIIYRVACVRCRRDGRTIGTRLIGRLRLVRSHTICVSCFNREKEVEHGANAKGARPKKWAGLFRARVTYVRGGRAIVGDHPTPVIDRTEVALTMFRLGRDQGVAWARPAIQRLH
ncbi:hypothetical protein [Burkholderia anthina]|uniref:hypothetical protein n=1 Tax=Burkholderia anthina TaxID=179879 RepID=UPI00158A9311|nr:hypothetical protein [Burkholderia anthina]